MSLEDILKSGKANARLEALEEAFSKEASLNLAPMIAEAKEEDVKKFYEDTGLSEEDYKKLTPAQNIDLLKEARGERQEDLIAKVKENYREAITKLGEKEKGLHLLRIIPEIKPTKIENTDESINRLHEKAYKAQADLKNPDESFNKIMEKYKNTTLGKAVLAFLIANDPELPSKIMQNRFIRSQAELYKELGENTTPYFTSQYESTEDKTKAGLAYHIGKTLGAIALAEESKKKAA